MKTNQLFLKFYTVPYLNHKGPAQFTLKSGLGQIGLNCNII